MIAMQHFAAVVNVGQTHRAAAWECDRPGRARGASRAGIAARAGIRTADSIPVVDAVARRDAIPEVDQIWIRPTPRVQLGQLGITQHPDPDPIAIRNAALFAIRIQGMRIEIDKQIIFFFKKFQLAAAGVLVALFAVNVIFSDQLNVDSIFGIQDSVATVDQSMTENQDAASNDLETVSFDFFDNLTDSTK